jgi:hypothetical protein
MWRYFMWNCRCNSATNYPRLFFLYFTLTRDRFRNKLSLKSIGEARSPTSSPTHQLRVPQLLLPYNMSHGRNWSCRFNQCFNSDHYKYSQVCSTNSIPLYWKSKIPLKSLTWYDKGNRWLKIGRNQVPKTDQFKDCQLHSGKFDIAVSRWTEKAAPILNVPNYAGQY